MGIFSNLFGGNAAYDNKINEYFEKAVFAWIWGMHEEAKVAALAAAKVANSPLRKLMIAHLNGMASFLENSHEGPVMRRHALRFRNLCKEISARDWSIMDSAREKQRLAECSPELLKALNNVDPTVFVRLYPILFS